ncbi:hypothetical protein GYB29_07300 [bacterium]|jgi:hypothetical protein|nr:hypothetical protein [Balneola sp.]MBR9917474.1 hypothetical protein [bacterium]
MRDFKKVILSVFVIGIFLSSSAMAQFEEPEIMKVENEDVADYEAKIRSFNLTGQGLYGQTTIDGMSSLEIRALLQGAFGDPTKNLESLSKEKNFRLAKAIQFEYWFFVDDPIADEPVPLLVLDFTGPFGNGVTFGAASKYVDLMPQIMRTFEKALLEAEPAEFSDYYFEEQRMKWYLIESDGKNHEVKPIKQPSHIKLN